MAAIEENKTEIDKVHGAPPSPEQELAWKPSPGAIYKRRQEELEFSDHNSCCWHTTIQVFAQNTKGISETVEGWYREGFIIHILPFEVSQRTPKSGLYSLWGSLVRGLAPCLVTRKTSAGHYFLDGTDEANKLLFQKSLIIFATACCLALHAVALFYSSRAIENFSVGQDSLNCNQNYVNFNLDMLIVALLLPLLNFFIQFAF